ncbi:hypothetical protein INS49_005116 [Diaporthe citri]|uniref:uncharacterized protein n=1 Tax=Diaporthe citri TaxID=83186 RepID=UPI001C7E3F1C|nr:uncharacterized protein INS49_005116 [Diaporthe citri]KAG6353859.1 hypothetical protein INS49_005116 [Diaporthe citri]
MLCSRKDPSEGGSTVIVDYRRPAREIVTVQLEMRQAAGGLRYLPFPPTPSLTVPCRCPAACGPHGRSTKYITRCIAGRRFTAAGSS